MSQGWPKSNQLSAYVNFITEKLKNTLRCPRFWPLDTPQGMDPGVVIMEWKPTLKGNYVPNMNAFRWVVAGIWTFEKLAYKTLSSATGTGTRMRTTGVTTIALLVLRTGVLKMAFLNFELWYKPKTKTYWTINTTGKSQSSPPPHNWMLQNFLRSDLHDFLFFFFHQQSHMTCTLRFLQWSWDCESNCYLKFHLMHKIRLTCWLLTAFSIPALIFRLKKITSLKLQWSQFCHARFCVYRKKVLYVRVTHHLFYVALFFFSYKYSNKQPRYNVWLKSL